MGRRGKIWEGGKKEKEEEESGKKCKKVLGIEGMEWGEMVGHLALGSKNEKHTQRKDWEEVQKSKANVFLGVWCAHPSELISVDNSSQNHQCTPC